MVEYLNADMATPQQTDYATGTTNGSNKTETSTARSDANENGWLSFDLSSLPDNAEYNTIVFTPCDLDPQSATAQELFIETGRNKYRNFYAEIWDSFSNQIENVQLNNRFTEVVEKSIARGTVSLGVVAGVDEADRLCEVTGWDSAYRLRLVHDGQQATL